MNFFDKLERKLARFAIPNLTLYIVVLYVGGFILQMTNPGFYLLKLSLNMERIFAGEVWRLFTFVIYPPTTQVFMFLLGLFILYNLGTTLERMWGRFYYNLYIFLGLFFLVLASLLAYLIGGWILMLTPDNLYMTLLLAFAMTLPEMQFLLYFIIPVKAKYLAIFYVALMIYQFVRGGWGTRISIIASFANALIFFFVIKNPARRVQQVFRRREYEQRVKAAKHQAQKMRPMGKTHHVCAVCGRSSEDEPNLEFRYCSKCSGGREYCMEHLYTHVHVE